MLSVFNYTRISNQASSDKIIREIELFGESFERYGQETQEVPTSATSTDKTVPGAPDKAKKGKIQSKSTGHTYQFQILESIGIPREEIKKFADPYYWLEYFPPIAIVGIFFS